jgi:hypothetical protein
MASAWFGGNGTSARLFDGGNFRKRLGGCQLKVPVKHSDVMAVDKRRALVVDVVFLMVVQQEGYVYDLSLSLHGSICCALVTVALL